MESDAKRRRLQSVLHTGGTSISGLSGILRKVCVSGSRSALPDVNKYFMQRVQRNIELPLTSGGTWTWEIAEPNLLLQMLVESSAELQELFARAARRYENSVDVPWGVIVGFDEYTPGDKFRPKKRRKSMVFSYNVLQLGPQALTSEMTWCTCAIARSTQIALVERGWPRMLRLLLHMLLTGEYAAGRIGIPLMLHGQVFNCFLKLKVILSDLDGLRMSFDWMGTSSHKPCLWCSNIWMKGMEVLPGQTTICDFDTTHFQRHSRESFFGTMDVLVEAEDRVLGGDHDCRPA